MDAKFHVTIKTTTTTANAKITVFINFPEIRKTAILGSTYITSRGEIYPVDCSTPCGVGYGNIEMKSLVFIYADPSFHFPGKIKTLYKGLHGGCSGHHICTFSRGSDTVPFTRGPPTNAGVDHYTRLETLSLNLRPHVNICGQKDKLPRSRRVSWRPLGRIPKRPSRVLVQATCPSASTLSPAVATYNRKSNMYRRRRRSVPVNHTYENLSFENVDKNGPQQNTEIQVKLGCDR